MVNVHIKEVHLKILKQDENMTYDNFKMIKKISKIGVGAFLILGTILSAFITITTIEDSFFSHTTWMYRPGWAHKALMIAFMLDFVLMTIAGFISTVSFFRKGTAWGPILKVIIINIICLMAIVILGAIISEIRFYLR